MTVRLFSTLCLGLALLATPLGCSCSGKKSISAQDAASLTGTVSYLERMALDPGAEVTVTLRDTDDPGTTLASRTFKTDGRQVPIPFQLPYTVGDIRREGNYGLSAHIISGGVTLFETAAPVPVLTQGRPSRDLAVQLRRVGS